MVNEYQFESIPFFIPKIIDSTILDIGTSFPALLMESPHVEWRPGVHEIAIKATDLLIIDPVTSHLLYPDARKKPSYKKLPYPEDINPEVLFSSQTDRFEKIIVPSVDDQIKKQANVIIAPYFYAVDTDDFKFTLNLTLLSETIKYLEKNGINLPIIANISIGKESLHRAPVLKYIIDLYKDNKDKLLGYLICINDLNPEKADLDQLNGLSYLVFNLSGEKHVFVKYIGGFGEVLSAIGATGISSGLDGGEIFSIKNYESGTKGFGRKGGWTYVSELFDHINDTELKKIGYSCSCPFCNGGLPASKKNKKLHYLYKKIEAMKIQENHTREENIDHMIGKIATAIQKIRIYNDRFAVNLKSNFLQNWQKVLEISKSWEYETDEDTEGLEKLLIELKSE
jgi:hypothetical protein